MLRRLTLAMSPAALAASVCALVVAGAGVGYSAAQIGTSDIKDSAVTAPKLHKNAVSSGKVQDHTLTKTDLVKEAKYKVPSLGNGTQNDCVWTDLSNSLVGLPKVAYRVDRFGTVHLTGFVQPNDVAASGDGECGNSTGDDAERFDDETVFRLPKADRPDTTVLRVVPSNDGTPVAIVIPGRHGLTVPGTTPTTLPWGVVVGTGAAGNAIFLDGVTFETTAAGVAGPVSTKSLPREARSLLLGALGR